MSKSVLSMFSSRSFMVSSLMFRSSIYSAFIFVYGVRECCNFILLHVTVQFSQHHLLKRLYFFHCIYVPHLLYPFISYFYFIFGCVGSSVRARAFSSCGKRGPLFIAVRGPLFIAVRGPFSIAAPPVAGRRLSNCGSRAQLLRGMWDLPRPGLEPVSPALAGRFSTTAPPGKP